MFDGKIEIDSEIGLIILIAIISIVLMTSGLSELKRQKADEKEAYNQFHQHLQQISSVKPNTASFNEQTSKQEIPESQSKKCLFCGEAMPESQLFCGVCGRRQD